MDAGYLQAGIAFLALLVVVIGSALGVLWGMVLRNADQQQKFQVHVAEKYATEDEVDRRIGSEVRAVRELLQRIESDLGRLLRRTDRERESA